MSTFSPPPTPSYAQATPKVAAAKLVTDLLAPAYLVIVVLPLVGLHGSGLGGAVWGLLAALFCGLLPLVFLRIGVRRGAITDVHVRVRAQRILPLSLALGSVVTGVLLLHLLGAPRDVVALVVAMLVGLAATLAVTVWWQISVHAAVAAGAAMILLLVYGWPGLAATLVVPAIGWSRLVLKAHTPLQVVCGTALGTVSALTFLLLR